jgi:hypothetical protein
MHKRSKEILASASSVLALAVGITACSSKSAEQRSELYSKTASSYTPRLQKAAQRIVQLANLSTTRYTDKPPHTVGFTLTTREGGLLRYAVQTPTSAPDTKSQLPNISEIELVEIQQTGPHEANFDLSFYARYDGKWNMYCDTNPFADNGRKIAELGQRTVWLNGKTVDKRPQDANAMLSDEVVNLENLVGTGAAFINDAPASPNICNINIG